MKDQPESSLPSPFHAHRLKPLPPHQQWGENNTDDDITAIRIPAIVELPEPGPEPRPLWREMEQDAREQLVCQVLVALQGNPDWHGGRIPIEGTYTRLLDDIRKLLEWSHGEFFHQDWLAQAIERRIRYYIGPGLPLGVMLSVQHILLWLASPQAPGDMAYAFVETYGTLAGIEVPLYGDRWQKSFTREPISTEPPIQSQSRHEIEEKAG